MSDQPLPHMPDLPATHAASAAVVMLHCAIDHGDRRGGNFVVPSPLRAQRMHWRVSEHC
jgi:hypothetical protein